MFLIGVSQITLLEDDDVLIEAIGGKGFGVRTMLSEIPPGADPLSADNVFIIATGPATGTRMWGQSRFGVYTKSPATGGFGESYCGGTLAPKIKGCGFDFLIIKGRAGGYRRRNNQADA